MRVSDVPRSTADARRVTVVGCAVRVLARRGSHPTPVTEVADAAGISQASVVVAGTRRGTGA